VLFDRAIGLDGSVGQFGVALGECPNAGANQGFDPTTHHDQLDTQAPNIIPIFLVDVHPLPHDRRAPLREAAVQSQRSAYSAR
jgi:hypothetical protein